MRSGSGPSPGGQATTRRTPTHAPGCSASPGTSSGPTGVPAETRRTLLAQWTRRTADRAEDPWDEVVDRLDSVGQAQSLASAIRALPAAERDVLLLVAWEQLTPAQAARALGVPAGTARSRLHRARATLRLILTEEPA